MNARKTALDALIACRKNGAWANGTLKEYCARDHLDGRDAALAARLCYGVLQNRYRLDFYLKQLLSESIRRLHPAARDILHLGLYQIYDMDRIPDSAAVNECVKLAKKYVPSPKAAALVNGVLRSAIRTKETISQPVTLEDRYSHPQALIDRLAENVGKDRLEAMLQADNAAPPTVVQVNTLRIDAQTLAQRLALRQVDAHPHAWLPDCLILENTGDLEGLPEFREGLFYIQDAAARLSVLCARLPQTGARVLDCCAAPGGKSFATAIAMGGRGSVLSADIYPHKTQLLDRGAKRLGLSNLTAVLQDGAESRPEWVGQMDTVIADVPCSGLGIIRKKPDIRYKSLSEAAKLPALQLRILSRAADYVKPGGVLIYSTCTLLREENEGVVEALLKQRPDFSPEPLELPDVFPKNTSGMLTLIPGEYDTDGFFICRLRRRACTQI